jgi:hypothetical protein
MNLTSWISQRTAEMMMRQELDKLDNTRIFPTKHPQSGNSNVVTSTVQFDDNHYIIPTMIGGKQLDIEEAIKVAQEQGLEKYPSYKDPSMAEMISRSIHGNISSNGIYKKQRK